MPSMASNEPSLPALPEPNRPMSPILIDELDAPRLRHPDNPPPHAMGGLSSDAVPAMRGMGVWLSGLDIMPLIIMASRAVVPDDVTENAIPDLEPNRRI